MAAHSVIDVVILISDTGWKLVLRDVRHVHDIQLNIISSGKLDHEGYANYFGEGLPKDSLVIARC